MTHLDNTTITPNGQGSSGHDKSNAAPSPYTHFDAPSTLAGLLDSLVADAHAELGTQPPTPTALDVFLADLVADAAAELAAERYGSNAPVYHASAAIHGDDADLLQRILSLPADGVLSPAWGTVYATGRTPGKPENQELVGMGIRDENTPICPSAPKVYIAPGWVGPFCLIDSNVKRRQRSDSQQVQTCFNCGDCGPCLTNWQYRKRHKYEWLTSGQPEQTIVVVSGLFDDDLASVAAIAIGRAGDADRSVFLVLNKLTYHWDAAVVFHSALPPKARLNIQRGRDRAGQDCTIETRAVAGVEIVETWVPTKKRTPGYHQPCRNVAAGIAQPTEREYAYSDGFVVKATEVPDDVPWEHNAPIDVETHPYADAPTDTNSKRTAKLRARNRIHIRRWLTGVTLDPDALLTLRNARRQGQRGDWFNCIASGAYDGPKRLIIDLALALDDDAMVSLDTLDGLRLASSYIRGN